MRRVDIRIEWIRRHGSWPSGFSGQRFTLFAFFLIRVLITDSLLPYHFNGVSFHHCFGVRTKKSKLRVRFVPILFDLLDLVVLLAWVRSVLEKKLLMSSERFVVDGKRFDSIKRTLFWLRALVDEEILLSTRWFCWCGHDGESDDVDGVIMSSSSFRTLWPCNVGSSV